MAISVKRICPSKNACTDISFAAFKTVVASCPCLHASIANAKQGKRLKSGSKKLNCPTLKKSKGSTPDVILAVSSKQIHEASIPLLELAYLISIE